MPKHEEKSCGRCGVEFECKSGSISLCQCQSVRLSYEQLLYISDRFDDCLCADCLAALAAEFDAQ